LAGNIYAPKGAANDPTGLNNNWLSGVNKFYSELATKETPLANAEQDNKPELASTAVK
jgi:hypothetical protein